ncbi:MAG: hypothetical protein DRO11_08605, partial [Methanobacteriota archaeon]
PNGANYTGDWDSSGQGVGWRNVEMNSSKQYYENGTYLKPNSFQVRKVPVLSAENIDPDESGWGTTYGASVYVVDPDGGMVNVSLWKSVGGGDWEYMLMENCTDSDCISGNTLQYTPMFHCDDLVNGPTINLKFNATDNYGLTAETSNFTLTLHKDGVSFTKGSGEGETINRESGSQSFSVTIQDTNRSTPVNATEETKPINGSFYFGIEDATFDWGHVTSISDETGVMTYNSLDPNCSYKVGTRDWYAEITGNDCYHDTSMGQSDGTYYVKGQLYVDLYEPLEDSEWNVTNMIDFGWNIYSDCYGQGPYDNGNITGVTNDLDLNHLGNTSTCTAINDPLSDGNYNCTWNSTTMAEGNWTVNITADLTDYYQNFTRYSDWFYLNNLEANLTNPTVSPSSGGWGTNYTYTIAIIDNENDTTTCQLYVNTSNVWSYRGSSTITPSGNCSVSVDDYDCTDQSDTQFYFVINDTYNTVNTSQTLGINVGPTIAKNDIGFILSSGNGSYINRSDTSIVGITSNLVVIFNDTTRNSVPLEDTNGTIWITTDNSTFDSGNDTDTNSTGHLEISFNPSCSYSTGLQFWKVGVDNDACYNSANTTINYTINVLGNISNFRLRPLGEEYLRGDQNITIEMNATSDCTAETLDDATVNMSYTNETGQTIYCDPIINEGSANYTCTFNTSTLRTRWHNITINTTRVDYNNRSTTYSNAFWIETRPFLTNMNLTPIADGWGKSRTFWVNASDEDNDTLSVILWYRMDGDEYTSGNSSTNTSESGMFQNLSFTLPGNKATFDGNDIGTWYYKFNMTDNYGNTNETIESTFTIEQDDTWMEYIVGNNSIINRSSTSTSEVILGLRAWDIDYDTNDPLDYEFVRFFITNDS